MSEIVAERPEIEPRASYSVSQEFYHYTTAANYKSNETWLDSITKSSENTLHISINDIMTNLITQRFWIDL